MWKQKLIRASLSAILHRNLPLASRVSVDSASGTQLSATISSLHFSLSGEEASGTLQSPSCHFIGNIRFCGKNFCSESTTSVVHRCWNCSSVAETTLFLVCGDCGSVQPVDRSVDYFQIFGLEKKFEIEEEILEGKYKNWQKKLHPDLVHSKSKEEKVYAAEQSARVIDAYRTLGDPLSRAMYILKLDGFEVDEEKTISEPELLAEIMEIREAVEEAADPQTLSQIQTQIQKKLKDWSHSFANAFQSRKYEEAQTSIQRMTYYKRINEEIIKRL